ncbi:MAG: UDP-3-O-(3-hydroxymyristoyl)glucosamine N-acyltransferase [Candidatus Eisenbacteria bacterium]|uniref:UDP-3-O-acylglucosamine N-acyltransferase n=1 Tax=Eiseniibacteriota bacterium TaxID=2212470 RepID=A0A933SEH0_UNCEI|nr:UDP-3-O-(3-hydroxymyristoyl)glucosamine N-acyltransferase [Candidatus Eisenbacteria bacterium]
MQTRTLAELAEELGGTVVGDPATVVKGVAGIREAQSGDITFIANSRYDAYLHETKASAVICGRETRESTVPLLQVDNPYLAFQKVVKHFRPELYKPLAGVHPSAVVSPAATLGTNVSVGAHCVVEAGAKVGANTVLMPGCYVGVQAAIGDDCMIYPRVVIREECVIGDRCIIHPGAVIGADGFGFAFDSGRYHKVPQVGTVIVGNDVEIGANATIDRATTHATRIGDGTKIDNLVQIGHNVVTGQHCIVVAQVGISGSTELEDYVTIGGQAGVIGHVRLGKGSMIGGQSGVTKSVPPGAKVSGYPAIALGIWRRMNAYIQRLPQLFDRTKQIEERLDRLEQNTQEGETVR